MIAILIELALGFLIVTCVLTQIEDHLAKRNTIAAEQLAADRELAERFAAFIDYMERYSA